MFGVEESKNNLRKTTALSSVRNWLTEFKCNCRSSWWRLISCSQPAFSGTAPQAAFPREKDQFQAVYCDTNSYRLLLNWGPVPGATEEITPFPVFGHMLLTLPLKKTLPGLSTRLTYSERLEELSGPFWWDLCLYAPDQVLGSSSQVQNDRSHLMGKTVWLQELQSSYTSSAWTCSLTWQIGNERAWEGGSLTCQSVSTPHDTTTPPRCCASSFHIRFNVRPHTPIRPIHKPVSSQITNWTGVQVFYWPVNISFVESGFALKLSALLEYGFLCIYTQDREVAGIYKNRIP